MFGCIVKKFRPLENQEEREIRVQLMWRIFQAAKYKEVKSDSVIKDHRQVYLQNDLDYLINEIVDYTDLLNQNLPATNQWAEPEIQQAIHNMSGVMLDELSKVEELFDLHIDVFDLKEVEKKGKTQKTAANVVRLSERPSDRAVDLLLETENGGGHYYMVTDTKKLFQKLICPHCSAIIKNLKHYKTHVVKCEEGRARHIYPGGFHKQPLGIRDKLESVGIKIPQDLAYYKEFICYDFEAMFRHISEKTEKTKYFKKHFPVSYVVCDSLGDHELL